MKIKFKPLDSTKLNERNRAIRLLNEAKDIFHEIGDKNEARYVRSVIEDISCDLFPDEEDEDDDF